MCGVQAHYRLDYIVGNNAEGEKTCRACHWKSWARDGRNLIESYVHDDDLLAEASEQFELPRGWSRQRIRSAVEENGYGPKSLPKRRSIWPLLRIAAREEGATRGSTATTDGSPAILVVSIRNWPIVAVAR